MKSSMIRRQCIIAAVMMLGIAAPAPAGDACAADLTGDGSVGFADLLTLLNAWGPCPPPPEPCPADIDGSGVVGFTDLLVVLGNWGPTGDCGPVITDFFPTTGGPGTLITITGTGFSGGEPDDHCVVIRLDTGRLFGCPVLEATDTQLVAFLPNGPITHSGVPHQLMVGVGDGARIEVIPDFEDVEVLEEDHVWVWAGDPLGMALADGFFVPTFEPDPDKLSSGPPEDGVLCLIIDQDWGENATVTIQARIHCAGTKNDTAIWPNGVRFTAGGTKFDCAVRLCNLLEQAFANHPTSPPLDINCNVTAVGEDAKITIALADGCLIDDGNLDICPTLGPVITDVFPVDPAVGDFVTVEGIGFLDDQADVCAVVDIPGPHLVALDPVEVTNRRIIAQLLPHIGGGEGGPILIGLGEGSHNMIEVPGFSIPLPAWGFTNGPGQVPGTGPEIFPEADTHKIVAGEISLDGTKACLLWNQTLLKGDKLQILCRIWAVPVHLGGGGQGFDCRIPCIEPEVTLGPNAASLRICLAIEQAYAAAGLQVECTRTEVAPGEFEICVSFTPARLLHQVNFEITFL